MTMTYEHRVSVNPRAAKRYTAKRWGRGGWMVTPEGDPWHPGMFFSHDDFNEFFEGNEVEVERE